MKSATNHAQAGRQAARLAGRQTDRAAGGEKKTGRLAGCRAGQPGRAGSMNQQPLPVN